MPKLFGKEIPPVALLGLSVVAIYLIMQAMQSPETPTTRKKPTPPAAKKNTDVDYTVSDYTYVSPALGNVTPKDAFRPLITKGSVSGGQNPSIDNFTYSGMALLNNEANGLLENNTTGEGDFVKPGQTWHQQWLVVSVSPDQIDLRNDLGEDTVLKVGSATGSPVNGSTGNATAPAGAAPFNPSMVGAIGGADLTMQPDQSGSQTNNNNGNRRGRGRNRGGGRNSGSGGINDGN